MNWQWKVYYIDHEIQGCIKPKQQRELERVVLQTHGLRTETRLRSVALISVLDHHIASRWTQKCRMSGDENVTRTVVRAGNGVRGQNCSLRTEMNTSSCLMVLGSLNSVRNSALCWQAGFSPPHTQRFSSPHTHTHRA